ncbi:MAG: Homoserine kinase [Pelotomaculum sp. PtaB.Bin104]|nr:MAG: Homoserine kinase [Pelotomaculum sp. PtaB.Bin104]
MIRVQVPATTANLGPGFDCLGMALELHNVVEMTPASSGLTIEVSGEGAADLPRNGDNLVYQAAQRVFQQVGFIPAGLRLRLINQAPVARGLGTGTAAIVGGIIAANLLTGGRLSVKEIIALASSIGGWSPGIVPAVLGGIVVSLPADGEAKYLKIQPPQGLKSIVAVPEFLLPPNNLRDILPSQVPFQDAVFNVGRVALLVAALQQGNLSLLGTAMEDHLQQYYRALSVPVMKKVLAATKLAGARGVTVSGAGPAVVALAESNFELIARVMGDTFRQNGVKCRVMILKPSPVGARALEVK